MLRESRKIYLTWKNTLWVSGWKMKKTSVNCIDKSSLWKGITRRWVNKSKLILRKMRVVWYLVLPLMFHRKSRQEIALSGIKHTKTVWILHISHQTSHNLIPNLLRHLSWPVLRTSLFKTIRSLIIRMNLYLLVKRKGTQFRNWPRTP